MDKNKKFLKKLSQKEFDTVEGILQKLLSRDIDNLDIKKLSGFIDVYRVRTGNIRIIFLDNGSDTEILEIGRRSENTYKKY